MQQVPLQAVPSQNLSVVLGNQKCLINIYSLGQTNNLFFDINVNGSDIVTGIVVLNAVPLVCIQYTGFQGNLLFIDTQGSSDPTYDGLGSRYQLVYLTAAENALL